MHRFLQEEDGAATVDWVVLAAACVALAIGVTDVTANAMASLSNDVRAELTNTDPSRNYFDELMNLAAFTGFEALYDGHGEDWGNGGLDTDGRNWAQAAYDSYAGLDNQALQDYYTDNYEAATDALSPSAASADHVTVIERVMEQRGIPIPEGNLTADELRGLFTTA